MTGVTFVCLFFSSHQLGMEFRASSVLEYDDELTGLIKSGSATDGSAHVENVLVSSIGVTNQTDEGVCAGVFHSSCLQLFPDILPIIFSVPGACCRELIEMGSKMLRDVFRGTELCNYIPTVSPGTTISCTLYHDDIGCILCIRLSHIFVRICVSHTCKRKSKENQRREKMRKYVSREMRCPFL